MKKLIYLIIPIVLIGCDDGDIITNDFDFEDAAVELCPVTPVIGQIDDYVFFKNEDANFETLALSFQTADDILNELTEHGPYSITSANSNSFEYRKLDAAPGSNYYCNNIPPSSPRVIEVFEAIGGEITVTTSIRTLDDNDGIPADQEGAVFVDGVIDHNATNHQDTDGDGIPDYRDEDDDGDNVPTSLEGVVLNDNGTINMAASRNTDSATENTFTLDYLDPDDDGDGVLTRNESTDDDIDPTNDGFDPSDPLSVPNYRNALFDIPASPLIEEYIEHSIRSTTQLRIVINDLTLSNQNEEIVFSTYLFGDYVKETVLLTCTPEFMPPTGSDECIFQ